MPGTPRSPPARVSRPRMSAGPVPRQGAAVVWATTLPPPIPAARGVGSLAQAKTNPAAGPRLVPPWLPAWTMLGLLTHSTTDSNTRQLVDRMVGSPSYSRTLHAILQRSLHRAHNTHTLHPYAQERVRVRGPRWLLRRGQTPPSCGRRHRCGTHAIKPVGLRQGNCRGNAGTTSPTGSTQERQGKEHACRACCQRRENPGFPGELVASFENHANLLLWLGNTDSGAGLHTLHTRSLHQKRIDTTCCNHADARAPIRNGVPRISLTSFEGM